MTIALGILASDAGLVIAADTQESWGYLGGAKISSDKIVTRVVAHEQRACSATGAGSAGYLDTLNQELTDKFVDVPERERIERQLREKIHTFYTAHVLPMHVFPSAEQPTVEVVLGMSWNGKKPMLLANDRSTLRRCQHYVTVGVGRAHASMLLNRLLPTKKATSIEVAAFLAAYVIFQVKSYVEGCGMGTHVTVLIDGTAGYIPEKTIEVLEKCFGSYLRQDARIVEYLSGLGKNPLQDFNAWVIEARHLIDELHLLDNLTTVIDESAV